MYRKSAAGVLAQILGHIAFYCKENRVSPLTTLVVVKARGKPGYRIPVDPSKIDRERESVYEFDWFDIHPPSEEELADAYQKHQGRTRPH